MVGSGVEPGRGAPPETGPEGPLGAERVLRVVHRSRSGRCWYRCGWADEPVGWPTPRHRHCLEGAGHRGQERPGAAPPPPATAPGVDVGSRNGLIVPWVAVGLAGGRPSRPVVAAPPRRRREQSDARGSKCRDSEESEPGRAQVEPVVSLGPFRRSCGLGVCCAASRAAGCRLMRTQPDRERCGRGCEFCGPEDEGCAAVRCDASRTACGLTLFPPPTLMMPSCARPRKALMLSPVTLMGSVMVFLVSSRSKRSTFLVRRARRRSVKLMVRCA